MTDVIVVTGLPGSGKTTLSRLIQRSIGFAHINLGDELLQRLGKESIVVQRRQDIGPLFLEAFGLPGYLDVVTRSAAEQPCVLDGVRLACAIPELRKVARLAHFYRQPPPFSRLGQGDAFATEDGTLRSLADDLVPWYPTERDLEDHLSPPVLQRLIAGLPTRDYRRRLP